VVLETWAGKAESDRLPQKVVSASVRRIRDCGPILTAPSFPVSVESEQPAQALVHISSGDTLLLIVAGLFAGVMNAVAGGGTFLTFPALVFIGIPSVAANQTSTIAVFPGQIASFWAYRKILAAQTRTVIVLGMTSLLGGAVGAIILLNTSTPAFDRLVPWLLLAATLMFTFGNQLRRHLGWRLVGASGEVGSAALIKSALLQLVIGVYGGFYGAGAGILELAVLDMLGLENIHLANALKVILTTAFNTLAVVIFLAVGKIYWAAALILGLATIAGGYSGAWIAQRLPQVWVRGFVIVVGAIMTIYFFLRIK
jgi:uncharacterized membrane protein YfcA